MSTLAVLTLLFSATATQTLCTPPHAVGTRSHSYLDSARMNRPVSVLLRYPAVAPGGANAPALTGCTDLFPVFSFGHGFTISNTGYDYWTAPLAEQGFIVVLPGTETGLAPSHDRFAADLVFAARAVQSDVFFASSVGSDRMYGGHSMGGGSAFLAASRDQNARALFVMAPAETNPSAIAAATQVRASTFIELGSRDCVTPRAAHGQALFDALTLPSKLKFIDEIPGGSHCQFATGSVTCALGEQSCGGSASISIAMQQSEARADLLEFLIQLGSNSGALFFDGFE
jgi:predicted dienelactone hydrolase